MLFDHGWRLAIDCTVFMRGLWSRFLALIDCVSRGIAMARASVVHLTVRKTRFLRKRQGNCHSLSTKLFPKIPRDSPHKSYFLEL